MEKEILDLINTKTTFQKTFLELTSDFESKFSIFNPTLNCFSINEYFGIGQSVATSKDKLIKDSKIKTEWLNSSKTENSDKNGDFKGLYIFINENTPFYVGISQNVIKRVYRHISGNNHNTATLAYKIATKILPKAKTRKDFDFKNNGIHFKKFLLKQRIAWLPIENDEELYLFEVYCSMRLQTSLNTFKTH